MSCLSSPRTLEEFFGVINSCATSYGGEEWLETALLGLIAACLAGIVLIGFLALLRR